MKVFFCFFVISGMVNVNIGLLFGRGSRGGQQEEHIVKHLHQHEIKIIHEGADAGGGAGHIGGGGGEPDSQFLLLGEGSGGGFGGGSVGHGGFGHNTGVFNGGGSFNNFGGSNSGSFGGVDSFNNGGGITGSTPTQIIELVHENNNYQGQFANRFGNTLSGGFTGQQIVGFIEEGHARGFGGGHSHGGGGIVGGFTAPQIVEFVEEGHSRGFGGGHAHGVGNRGGFTDAQIVEFVEEGHARGYGGGHGHDSVGRFTAPEIAGFVEDGLEHGYGGRHSTFSHGDSGINGDLTSILGLVEDEHIHEHSNNFQLSNGGDGEQILQILHDGGQQNSIEYNDSGSHGQHFLKVIRNGNYGDQSYNGHSAGGENIKIVKVIAENRHGHGHEKVVKIIRANNHEHGNELSHRYV